MPKEAAEAEAASPSVASRATGSPRRVLVVDDNVASADSLGLIVKLWGHESRVSHSGPEAIDEAKFFRPDVVLLDIGLPGMDGYAVARALRSHPHLSGVVLIAMTGYGREEDRRRTRDAGFDEHLVKPLDLDALEGMLAQLGDPDAETDPPS
jgi:CheY-like chemotaxis protein